MISVIRAKKELMEQNSMRYQMEQLHVGNIALDLKRVAIWKTLDFEPNTWDAFGFQVFSQSNEDGIIQYLISNISIKNKTFIEFGVEDYTECNTKFLLLNNRWSGLIMDGSEKAMQSVRNSWYYWKHDLVAVNAFITKENINDLVKSREFDPEVGILSIDIDGNDYWVWETIDEIYPAIVIVEINPIFGTQAKITIPYQEDFFRTKAHYSNLYWGMSLGAAVHLADKKGYKLVCMGQLGHNAFFVRKDLMGETLKEVSVEEAYRPLTFRESRDQSGKLTYLNPSEGLKLIGDCEVVDVTDMKLKKIKDLIL